MVTSLVACMTWIKRFLLVVISFVFVLNMSLKAQASRPIRRQKNEQMKIALTFDDGPDDKVTNEILDILNEYDIKATFFVIGKNCDENMPTLKRIFDEGHEIGNHTYSHPHLSKISAKKLSEEIIKTEEIIFSVTNTKPKLFRPPEGVYSSVVEKVSVELGYVAVLWSVDTLDWAVPKADKIADAVLNSTTAGEIILCHDYVAGKSNTPEALRIFIPKLLDQGYEFVTVSDLVFSRA